MPLAFCRECGQEYLTVWRTEKDGDVRYEARRDTSATGGRQGDGYLYIDHERAWPSNVQYAVDDRRLPESWLELDDKGQEVVKKSYRDRVPRAVTVDPLGREGSGELQAAFIPSPFLFCLHCGVAYEQTRGRDFAKLATLDQEGRSSATSLISASVVRSLKSVPEEVLDKEARKLLTFVDNRQDASLQAGHFNDFVQITQLRGLCTGRLWTPVRTVSTTRTWPPRSRTHSPWTRPTTRVRVICRPPWPGTPPRPSAT